MVVFEQRSHTALRTFTCSRKLEGRSMRGARRDEWDPCTDQPCTACQAESRYLSLSPGRASGCGRGGGGGAAATTARRAAAAPAVGRGGRRALSANPMPDGGGGGCPHWPHHTREYRVPRGMVHSATLPLPPGSQALPAPLYVLTPGLCPHWRSSPKGVHHRTHARPAHPRQPHPARPSGRTQVGPSLSSPPPAAASAGVHSSNSTGRSHGAASLVARPRPRPWHGSIEPTLETASSAGAPLAQRPFPERGSRLDRLQVLLVAVPLVRSRARGGRRANIPASSVQCARSAGRHRPVRRAVGLAFVPRWCSVRHAPPTS